MSSSSSDCISRGGKVDWSSHSKFEQWLQSSVTKNQKDDDSGNCQAISYSFVKFALSQRLHVPNGPRGGIGPLPPSQKMIIDKNLLKFDPFNEKDAGFQIEIPFSNRYLTYIRSKKRNLPKKRRLAFGKVRTMLVKEHLVSRCISCSQDEHMSEGLNCTAHLIDEKTKHHGVFLLELSKKRIEKFLTKETPHISLTKDLEFQCGLVFRKLTVSGHFKQNGEILKAEDTEGHCFNWLHVRSKKDSLKTRTRVDYLVFPDCQCLSDGEARVYSRAAPNVGSQDSMYQSKLHVTIAPSDMEFAKEACLDSRSGIYRRSSLVSLNPPSSSATSTSRVASRRSTNTRAGTSKRRRP